MTLAAREAELLARIADGDAGARRILADYWIQTGETDLVARGTLVHAMHEGRSDVADAILHDRGGRWIEQLVAARFRRQDVRFELGFLPAFVFDDHALVGSPQLLRLSPVHYRLGRRIDGARERGTHEATRITTACGDTIDIVRVAAAFEHAQGAYEIERELALLARVQGPHVVELRGPAVATNGPALAMAWAGLDLDALIARDHGRYAIEPIAIAIGIQLARACEALHVANLVHGWLRPDHVMVCDGIVRVGAFARATADLAAPPAQIRMATGTVREQFDYMSPEQVLGRLLTPASDVFSLAVLIAELAGTSALPPAASDFDRLAGIRDVTHRVADTRSQLAPLLRTAIVREQQARPSMRALGDGLERVARDAGWDVSPTALAARLA